MKNKGRKHKAGRDERLQGICNTKSMIVYITRPIRSMSAKGHAESKFDKKKWVKRMRGYLKSQTKEI